MQNVCILITTKIIILIIIMLIILILIKIKKKKRIRKNKKNAIYVAKGSASEDLVESFTKK